MAASYRACWAGQPRGAAGCRRAGCTRWSGFTRYSHPGIPAIRARPEPSQARKDQTTMMISSRARMRASLRLTALVLSLVMALAAAAAEPSEIRVAEQYGLAFLPLMIMRDQRLIERRAKQFGLAKLEVKWARLGAVSAINDALLAGELDFAAGGVPSLVLLWSKTRGTPEAVRGIGAPGRGGGAPFGKRRDHRTLLVAPIPGARASLTPIALHPLDLRRARRTGHAERDLDAGEVPRRTSQDVPGIRRIAR